MTSIGLPHDRERPAAPASAATAQRLLLLCGVLAPLVYVAMDVTAA